MNHRRHRAGRFAFAAAGLAAFAALLALGEYAVSLIAPTSGPLASIAFAGEMTLAIFSTAFGSIAAGLGLYTVFTDTAFPEDAEPIAFVGSGIGVGGALAGAFDIVRLYQTGP